MIAAFINSVPLKLIIKQKSACVMYINPKFEGSIYDQDCRREKAISHLTACRSLGINLHTAPCFPSSGILIFAIYTAVKNNKKVSTGYTAGGTGQWDHLPPTMSVLYLELKTGTKSKRWWKIQLLTLPNSHYGFRARRLQKSRHSLFAEREKCPINMFPFLSLQSRVIFLYSM